MKLQNNQNVSFKGTVSLVDLTRNKQLRVTPDNPLLRPLIRQLKHNTHPKVHHTINVGDIQIGVHSRYKPAKTVDGLDAFVKEHNIVMDEPLKEGNVAQLIESSKETKRWMKEIRTKEKASQKLANETAKNIPEPSLLKRLLEKLF